MSAKRRAQRREPRSERAADGAPASDGVEGSAGRSPPE